MDYAHSGILCSHLNSYSQNPLNDKQIYDYNVCYVLRLENYLCNVILISLKFIHMHWHESENWKEKYQKINYITFKGHFYSLWIPNILL